jgi:hypothetical protein
VGTYGVRHPAHLSLRRHLPGIWVYKKTMP